VLPPARENRQLSRTFEVDRKAFFHIMRKNRSGISVCPAQVASEFGSAPARKKHSLGIQTFSPGIVFLFFLQEVNP